MTHDSLIAVMSQILFRDNQSLLVEYPLYEAVSKDLAEELSSNDINLTRTFRDPEIPENTIAFHRIVGTIFADYDRWGYYFSTKQFIDDLKAAERNPNIIAHFIFANSGGGEAWYLEKAYEAIGQLKKPIISYVEKRNCSACYYITSNTNRIFSSTINDTHGSIGVMVAFLDIIPYFEALGAKWHEEYADQSTLKNKKFNDLLNGKPKKYKEKELNPLAEQFITAVRAARKPLADLPEKHDVFAGETYSAQESGSVGLIDQVADLEFALNYTLQQGLKYKAKMEKQTRIQTYID